MKIEDINIMAVNEIDRFKLLLQRQRELEIDATKIKEEQREIQYALTLLSGIKKGDTIATFRDSEDRVHVNTIESDIYITDQYFDHPDRVYLQVRGFGSPITRNGTPSKTQKYKSWAKIIKSVWISLEDYRKIVPRGE